jgi:hypothetical protein
VWWMIKYSVSVRDKDDNVWWMIKYSVSVREE